MGIPNTTINSGAPAPAISSDTTPMSFRGYFPLNLNLSLNLKGTSNNSQFVTPAKAGVQ